MNATLESTLESTTHQLSNGLSPPPPQDLLDRIATLESSLSHSHSQLSELQSALSTSQETAIHQLDAISKMHDQELTSLSEEHSNVLRSHVKEIENLKKGEKENYSGGPPGTPSKRNSVGATMSIKDVEGLHAAHSKKLAEVEEGKRVELEEMQLVSFPPPPLS
jgi:hypothetical protein